MDGRNDGRAKPPRDRVEHERGNGTLRDMTASVCSSISISTVVGVLVISDLAGLVHVP
jgi:hypothetical protein